MSALFTWPYRLRAGHSDNPAGGACAMDAVNWLVHGKHGDTPECACPVIGSYVISGNDAMDDATRQRLLPYLHRIAGSRSEDHVAARLRILVLASARVFAASALDAAGLPDEAATLRAIRDDAPYGVIAAKAESAMRRAARAKDADSAMDAAAEARLAAWNAAKLASTGVASGARAAEWSAMAASHTAAWDRYFNVLDEVLNAGPQGEPWSADATAHADALYVAAGGKGTRVEGPA